MSAVNSFVVTLFLLSIMFIAVALSDSWCQQVFKGTNCTQPYRPCVFPAGSEKNVSIDCISNRKQFENCTTIACFIRGNGVLCYCSAGNMASLYTCSPHGVGRQRSEESTSSVPDIASSPVTPYYDVSDTMSSETTEPESSTDDGRLLTEESTSSVTDITGSTVTPQCNVVSDATQTETTQPESSTENRPTCNVTWNCTIVDCESICCWIQTPDSDAPQLPNNKDCMGEDLHHPLCCQSSPSSANVPSESHLRLTVGLAVGLPLGALLLVSLVVIVVVIRRRRSRPNDPYQSLDKPTHANTYQTVQSAKTSDKLQSETYLYAPSSNYEEPVAVSINQSPIRHTDPYNRPATSTPPSDPLATYGDTTLVDNTLYNMDGNPTTTVSRDPMYNDTTLVDNSLYSVENDFKMSAPAANDDYEMTVIENSMYGNRTADN